MFFANNGNLYIYSDSVSESHPVTTPSNSAKSTTKQTKAKQSRPKTAPSTSSPSEAGASTSTTTNAVAPLPITDTTASIPDVKASLKLLKLKSRRMISAKPSSRTAPVNDTTVDDENDEEKSSNSDGSDIVSDSPKAMTNQRPMFAPAQSKPVSRSIAIDTSKCSRTSNCKCSACTIPIEALPVVSSTAPASSHTTTSSTTATQRMREQRSKQAAASVKSSGKTEK